MVRPRVNVEGFVVRLAIRPVATSAEVHVGVKMVRVMFAVLSMLIFNRNGIINQT